MTIKNVQVARVSMVAMVFYTYRKNVYLYKTGSP